MILSGSSTQGEWDGCIMWKVWKKYL